MCDVKRMIPSPIFFESPVFRRHFFSEVVIVCHRWNRHYDGGFISFSKNMFTCSPREIWGKCSNLTYLRHIFLVKDGTVGSELKNSTKPQQPPTNSTIRPGLARISRNLQLGGYGPRWLHWYWRTGQVGCKMPSPKWVQQLPVNLCYERNKRLYLPLVRSFEAMKLQSQVVFLCIF